MSSGSIWIAAAFAIGCIVGGIVCHLKMSRVRNFWTPTPEAQTVIDACGRVFNNTPGASRDCNKFIKAVCDEFGVNSFTEDDIADSITRKIRDAAWRGQNGWTGLEQDQRKAKESADRGELVIAGATSTDLSQAHGHLVVVVSSEAYWRDYPYASWGTLGGVGQLNAKMTLAYRYASLPKVSYMAKKLELTLN